MKLIMLTTLTFLSIICSAQKKRDIDFKIETDSSVLQYLEHKNISFLGTQNATLRGIGTFGEYGRSNKLIVPDALFFNKHGYLIENGGKGENCGASINKLEKLVKMKSNASLTLKNFLNEVTLNDGEYSIEYQTDIYIILKWAKWAPAESETTFKWLASLQNQNKLKIKILLLNLDIHERWNLSEEQKQYLGII
ncbi:hypothetical protein [Flavobacterium macacae]|uniref:Uncharacterized protein n=1 Tax=Flavobacterium macacae TaxID=2488993 RepID=A0A3P3W3P1_9FLAO|nr:hypothetical protein [Flavobacterium macacae]RRJ89722.1 hypothetical protein EG849_11965 [Flavobacterium macacae]